MRIFFIFLIFYFIFIVHIKEELYKKNISYRILELRFFELNNDHNGCQFNPKKYMMLFILDSIFVKNNEPQRLEIKVS